MGEIEEREWIIRFDALLERAVEDLATELLKDVSIEIIEDYYGDYTVVQLIKNVLEEDKKKGSEI